MGKNICKNILIKILLVVCFLLTPLTVNAETKTLRQYGSTVSESEYRLLDFDRSNYDTNMSVIPDFASFKQADLISPGDDSTRYVVYPDALDYFGTILTVRIDVEVLSGRERVGLVTADATYGYDNQVILANTNGDKAKVTISFFDEEDKPFNFSGLYGLIDPDLGNYKFSTTGRKLYFKDAGLTGNPDSAQKMADNINVAENGLFPVDTGTDYDEGIVFIQLNSESTFTIELDSWSDWVVVPYLYSMNYKVTYDLKDSEDFPATNDPTNPVQYAPGDTKEIKDPTRPGYEFVGWTRQDITDPESDKNDSILPDDRGDKHFIAEWKAIEYKLKYDSNNDSFPGTAEGTMDDQMVTVGGNKLNPELYTADGYKWVGWSTKPGKQDVEYADEATYPVTADDIEGKQSGDYVATLYAQWEPIEYLVRYDKNAEDATGEMPDQKPLYFDQDYTLDKNLFEREGYNWVGWNTVAENTGDPYTDEQGFKNLTKEDGGIVTMYAQWEPWKYYIDYDPNGGTGTMPLQTFKYQDPSMTSLRNQYTRDGYKFTGFLYYYKGSTKLITDPAEFKQLLLDLGPESKITLIAQWEKIPTKVVEIPVTGVE